MDPLDFQQESVDKQLFGDQHNYLVEDLEATLSFHDGEVVAGNSHCYSSYSDAP